MGVKRARGSSWDEKLVATRSRATAKITSRRNQVFGLILIFVICRCLVVLYLQADCRPGYKKRRNRIVPVDGKKFPVGNILSFSKEFEPVGKFVFSVCMEDKKTCQGYIR